MTTFKTEHCSVCGKPLDYRERPATVCCVSCGLQFRSAMFCPDGHYICDGCHSEEHLAHLAVLAEQTNSHAPEDILEELLALPGLPMHGPEHHAMTGLVLLLACARNDVDLPENFIGEAIRRSMQIPGGACGYHGACGAAISLGVSVSLVTRATPLTGLARGMAHRATALALLTCGDDGARCCKRALRKAVAAGREFFADELGITFPLPTHKRSCPDIARNRECAGQHCAYFNRSGKVCFQ